MNINKEDYVKRSEVYHYLREQLPLSVFMKHSITAALGSVGRIIDEIDDIPSESVIPITPEGIGAISDGYHTFDGLYYQRMILFAALVKAYKSRAWKSYKHEDGELCFGGGWFIVGIDTPEGGYTYHCENRYFDLFDCEELPTARHWDGHTEKDAVRLLSLPDVHENVYGTWVPIDELPFADADSFLCSECHKPYSTCGSKWDLPNYCPKCGTVMRSDEMAETEASDG